jgi:hypothetical protein
MNTNVLWSALLALSEVERAARVLVSAPSPKQTLLHHFATD